MGGTPINFPAPCDYILTFTKSVGFATDIPIVPVIIPAAIFCKIVGYYPGYRGPHIMSLTGVYNPILNPAKTIYLYRPALNPP